MSGHDELTEKLRKLGPQFNPAILAATRELYRAPVEGTAWAKLQAIENVAYGAAERQVLDVYPTERPNAPILLFVHGGGFVGGDKNGDGVFYGNVGRYFAHHGFLSVCMNYRLAPASTWPAGSDDVATALAWVVEHGAGYGGDADKIVVIGQSAGAAHVASVIFDDRFSLPTGVRAAALLSGFYEARTGLQAGPQLYFGEDERAWPDRSATSHVKPGHIPLLLCVAEFDPAQIAEQTLILAQALNKVDGFPPRLVWLENQNHVSAVHGFGLGEDAPGSMLRSFFESALPRP